MKKSDEHSREEERKFWNLSFHTNRSRAALKGTVGTELITQQRCLQIRTEQHAFYHRIGYTRSPIISPAIRQGFISMLETCHRRAQPFEIRKSYDNKPLFAGLQHTVSRRYCAPCTCSLSLFLFNFRSTLSRFRYQLLNRSVGEHVGRGGTATIPFVDRIVDSRVRWSLTGVVATSEIKKLSNFQGKL